ncbi:hypothetical protein PanWU01x14_038050 [Parasponia andersonii]|uniref:Uncharacterized protein n=1 Tax=Parasponia andersonii TaxID=3476 RepID=A0A2P5DS40_PARAD|nr:hypothetical protein PanWU01x14_038050 [Parasponia andersonii]
MPKAETLISPSCQRLHRCTHHISRKARRGSKAPRSCAMLLFPRSIQARNPYCSLNPVLEPLLFGSSDDDNDDAEEVHAETRERPLEVRRFKTSHN